MTGRLDRAEKRWANAVAAGADRSRQAEKQWADAVAGARPRPHIDPGYARSRRNLLAAAAIAIVALIALIALIVLDRAYAHHAALTCGAC